MTHGEERFGGSVGLGSVESLQTNAADFFARVAAKHEGALSCKAGCSACCYVALDVFESEAARIVAWAGALKGEERASLREALERAKAEGSAPSAMGIDAAGNRRARCVFLVDSQCSVYAARPVICRTQGAPLQLRRETPDGRTELSVDFCPLNFKEPGSLPAQAEWLDLQRLTTMQSLAEQAFQSARAADQEGAFSFPWKKNPQGRVSLAAVRRVLLEAVLA